MSTNDHTSTDSARRQHDDRDALRSLTVDALTSEITAVIYPARRRRASS